MKNSVRILFIAIMLLPTLGIGQVMPLNIGSKVPDIVFEKMLNHTSPKGKLSDFKGKAIIIDMWFLDCAPCVSAMPMLDSIQKVYQKDGLQILLYNIRDKKEAIQDFWANHRYLKSLKMTQVVEDTMIKQYFPAISFPTQIWINKAGYVIAITDGKGTTTENLQKFVNGEKVKLPLKVDELDLNVRHATLPQISIRYGENLNNLIYYSYFSKYRKEFSGMYAHQYDSVNNIVRVKFMNTSMINLYNMAYAGTIHARLPIYAKGAEFRIVRKDSNPISSIPDYENKTNIFCYELMYKPTKGDPVYASISTKDLKLSKYMVADLDRFFGFKSHEEDAMIDCYVISPNGNGKRYLKPLDSTKKQFVYGITQKVGKPLSVNMVPHWALDNQLTTYCDRPFYLDLEPSKKINFEVTWNPEHPELMNAELEKYDLKFEKTKRKAKVIILEDAD
ncbi:thiol-disulfide isomerase/thioredoxin [Lacibacter cauensis]|uniref:Thiol-disulfide isomerase/thioredoxin n=1 Tax=Lacibacter cauensis TaxID=510947 RepID=A0A562SX43_9BACT|nr:TlpA disulfide reductase family protein [Lacibacter cauensis]TWI85849.1 thiol-disulfide isomerase/thioredoxin [Lacibacter cauensis]